MTTSTTQRVFLVFNKIYQDKSIEVYYKKFSRVEWKQIGLYKQNEIFYFGSPKIRNEGGTLSNVSFKQGNLKSNLIKGLIN